MATNITQSLFPSMQGLLTAPRESLMAAPIQAAQQDPRGTLDYLRGNIRGLGASMQQGIGSMFGQKPAVVAQQDKMREAVTRAQQSGADMGSPEGLIALAQELERDPELAGFAMSLRQQAAEMAGKAEQRGADIEFKRAQAAQMTAKANAPVAPPKEDLSAEGKRYRELIALGRSEQEAFNIAYRKASESTDIRRDLTAMREDERKTTQDRKLRNTIEKIDRTIPKIRQAASQVSGFTAGLGSTLAVIPGTSARDLEANINTIKANLGFTELQQMREESPTGGALGQVAVQEINFLQSVIDSLDMGQSPDQLRKNLQSIERHYARWRYYVNNPNAGPLPAGEFPPDYSRPQGNEKPAAQPVAPQPRATQQPTSTGSLPSGVTVRKVQ
jgi:hypothetical protein